MDLSVLLDMIKKKAKETARIDNEDFSADDYAGGNIDDAYAYGLEDGEVLFARSVIEQLTKEGILL